MKFGEVGRRGGALYDDGGTWLCTVYVKPENVSLRWKGGEKKVVRQWLHAPAAKIYSYILYMSISMAKYLSEVAGSTYTYM